MKGLDETLSLLLHEQNNRQNAINAYDVFAMLCLIALAGVAAIFACIGVLVGMSITGRGGRSCNATRSPGSSLDGTKRSLATRS